MTSYVIGHLLCQLESIQPTALLSMLIVHDNPVLKYFYSKIYPKILHNYVEFIKSYLLFYPLNSRNTKKLKKQKLKCWVFINKNRILVKLFKKKPK